MSPARAGARPTDDLGICPLCEQLVEAWRPGPGGKRPRAACPHCGSLERHRFLTLLLQARALRLAGATALEVAPQEGIRRVLTATAGRAYGMDVDPAADGRSVDVVGDLCAAPFADGSVDVVVCYHVLEHIPDDRAAMRELARILSASGEAVVQVPRKRGVPTDEDPAAPVAERVRRFGQADHVRYYGEDFEDRLAAAGLAQRLLLPQHVLPRDLLALASIPADDPVWLVTRADAGADADPADQVVDDQQLGAEMSLALLRAWQRATARRADADRRDLAAERDAVAQLAAELETERERVAAAGRATAAAKRDARRWQKEYRRLRGRWPVRAMAAGGRAGRSAAAAARDAAERVRRTGS